MYRPWLAFGGRLQGSQGSCIGYRYFNSKRLLGGPHGTGSPQKRMPTSYCHASQSDGGRRGNTAPPTLQVPSHTPAYQPKRSLSAHLVVVAGWWPPRRCTLESFTYEATTLAATTPGAWHWQRSSWRQRRRSAVPARFYYGWQIGGSRKFG